MIVAVIAANSLRRLLRERTNLFFVFVMPLLLIVVFGASVAPADPAVRLVAPEDRSPAAERLVAALSSAEGMAVTVGADRAAAIELAEREEVAAVVIVPDGYGAIIDDGGTAEIELLSPPDSQGFEVRGIIQAVVDAESAELRAARAVTAMTGQRPAAEEVAAALAAQQPLARSTVDGAGQPFAARDVLGQIASQQLVLFTFVISMTASAALVQARRLGLTRRMLAGPVSPAQVVIGHLVGRYAVALVQAAVIMAGSAALGVDWGSWPAALAVVASFSLVGAACAALLGSFASNDNQSTAIGLGLGLGLAALGGCMVPFDVFPPGVRTVAHITPHAWAVDALTETVLRDGGLTDIGTELAVLSGYGVALLVAGSLVLRRVIVA